MDICKDSVVTHDRAYLEWMKGKAENISGELKDEILKVLK